MRVGIVNKLDISGGAARLTYRLDMGLGKIGLDSKIFVDNKISDNRDVYGSSGKIEKTWSKTCPFIDKVPLKFCDWQKTPFHLARIGKNIRKDELVKQADIVNLHWITGGFLSIRGISKFTRLGKPTVVYLITEE